MSNKAHVKPGLKFPQPKYIVICWDDGKRVVAVHKYFDNYTEAKAYTETMAPTRDPLVIEVVRPFRHETEVYSNV